MFWSIWVSSKRIICNDTTKSTGSTCTSNHSWEKWSNRIGRASRTGRSDWVVTYFKIKSTSKSSKQEGSPSYTNPIGFHEFLKQSVELNPHITLHRGRMSHNSIEFFHFLLGQTASRVSVGLRVAFLLLQKPLLRFECFPTLF